MRYYFAKTLKKGFDEALNQVKENLKANGFGIVSEIDMDAKFKEKLGVDFRRYKILGACSPKHAHQAVTAEEHIGLMLPCNVVLQEKAANETEVSVIDPIASMQAVKNDKLGPVATEIQENLQLFIKEL